MQKDTGTFSTKIVLLVCATIIVSAVFLIYPELDIILSGYFAEGVNGFPLNKIWYLKIVRQFYMVVVGILCIVPTFMLFVARKNSEIVKIPAPFWDWFIGAFVLGPLILVNMIFKSNWGRPRPAQIEEFGGQWIFTPPYYISDQCQLNCSFVSGEGSAIATSGILLGITSWKIFPNARVQIVSAITIISIIGISLRVIKGRHFVSDSLLAALFCALIILLLYRILKLHNFWEKVTLANIWHDLKSVTHILKPKS